MSKKYIYNICTGLLILQFLIIYATLWFNLGKSTSRAGFGELYFFTFYFAFALIYGLALSFDPITSKTKSIIGAIICGFPIALFLTVFLFVLFTTGTVEVRDGSLGFLISSGIILSLCVLGYILSIFVNDK